MDEQIN